MNDNTRQPRQNNVSQEELYVPMSNIKKMMKCSLPPNARISEDAKVAMQTLVSEYIIFITGEANDRCLQHLRKTITVEDIMFAMNKFGSDQHATILNTCKSRLQCSKRVPVLPEEPSTGHTVEFEKIPALGPSPVFPIIYPHQPDAGVQNPPPSHQSNVDALNQRHGNLPTLYPHQSNVDAYNPPSVFPTVYPHLSSDVGVYNPTPIVPSVYPDPDVGSYNPFLNSSINVYQSDVGAYNQAPALRTVYHHQSDVGAYNQASAFPTVYHHQPDVSVYNQAPAFPTVFHHQLDLGAYNPPTMISFDGEYPSAYDCSSSSSSRTAHGYAPAM